MLRGELKRADCRICVFAKQCGDIFPKFGMCPACNGGEEWANYQRSTQPDLNEKLWVGK